MSQLGVKRYHRYLRSGKGIKDMIIAGIYSFNSGKEIIQKRYPKLLNEIADIVSNIDAEQHKTKMSKEKTMLGRILYSPMSLNKAFKKAFNNRGWRNVKVYCDYPTKYYTENYQPQKMKGKPYREMDFEKENLGVELQLGKYAFMVYNVCAKMTIFNKLGFIDAGVEIVPIKQFATSMSTGVSYFEQFIWDLENRGVSDIDIPVIIYGIDA